MRLVVLGLSLSSSWGNGHATTYRALLRAFAARGHEVVFLERERSWYAAHRDLRDPDYCALAFYDSLAELDVYEDAVAGADAVMIGSYVPEGPAVIDWTAARARGALCFYDIDTPVTLRRLAEGDTEYLRPDQVRLFDRYFSFTGGPSLRVLERRWGARDARALFCAVDADAYAPRAARARWDLGYLGTYSADRQPALERLLLEPARRAPERRFVVAGPQYPATIDWPANVERIEHVGPADHPAFFAAQRWTLNITRNAMARAGHSPSVRLFEATACGCPVISDRWPGLETLFRDGKEIVVVDDAGAVARALAMLEPERRALGAAGRARCLRGHTAAIRAEELEAALPERSRAPARRRAFADHAAGED